MQCLFLPGLHQRNNSHWFRDPVTWPVPRCVLMDHMLCPESHCNHTQDIHKQVEAVKAKLAALPLLRMYTQHLTLQTNPSSLG